MRIEERDLEIAGDRIAARLWHPEGARGAPILLFHDSLGSVELWRDLPEVLARESGRVVAAYDRAGFGRSMARAGLPGVDFVADEARDVVPLVAGALGLDRFVAAGHSVGGGMAIETAAQHPDRVTGLITISAQAFAEDRTLDGIRQARAKFADPAALERVARYHGDKARWVVDAWTEVWLDPARVGWRLDTALSRVRCPVLAIHGGDDEYGSSAHPERITGLTGGRQVIVPGAGHLPHREAPEVVMAAILGFLTEVA